MSIYQPYFYIIGWTEHDMWYQGIQYGKNAHPSNLWNTYFTSSNYVKEFAAQHGDPDVIETLPLETAEQAIAEEIRYQRECDVLNDPRWLNKNISGAVLMDETVCANVSAGRTGCKHTRPAWNKGKRYTQRRKGNDHPLTGRKRDPATVEKMIATKRRLKAENPDYGTTEFSRTRASQVHKGKIISQEHREAISRALKSRSHT